jgi:hypothetical protein
MEEEIQVKEIKSTLPPMKIDMASALSTPTSVSDLHSSLRQTRSSETLPARFSSDTRPSPLGTPTPSQQQQHPYGNTYSTGSTGGGWGQEDDDRVEMTFDTAFDDTPAKGSRDRGDTPGHQRPEMKTAHTLPNMALADPWGDPDDDPDFGKEKEISMTFA